MNASPEDHAARSIGSDLWDIAIVVAVGVVISLLVSFLGDMLLGDTMPGGPFGIVAAVIAATLRFRAAGESWAVVGMGRKSWWRTLLLGLLGWIGVTILVAVVALMIGPPNNEFIDEMRGNWKLYLIMLLPIGWGTAAFGEELLFRGFLLHRVARVLGGGRWAWFLGLLMQAVVFGLMHAFQGPRGIALTGWIGFLIGIYYFIVGRNLWVAILIHGLIDTMGLTAIYLNADRAT